MSLATLQLRQDTRFLYEYDLHTPWRHEVRIEDWLSPAPGKAGVTFTSGSGACPPEDCGGPDSFMDGRDSMLSLDAMEDLDTMADILNQVALERRLEVADDDETRWHLE